MPITAPSAKMSRSESQPGGRTFGPATDLPVDFGVRLSDCRTELGAHFVFARPAR